MPTSPLRFIFFVVTLTWWNDRLVRGFVTPSTRRSQPSTGSAITTTTAFAYVPPAPERANTVSTTTKKLYPQIGDIVRYQEVDGGRSDGQILVGKISFIQKNLGNEKSGWTLEVNELEDLGEGYYAEYTARKRKKTLRDLGAVSPLSASFVRSEQAFKVPINKETRKPVPKRDTYDIEGYKGPFAGESAINKSVVEQDGVIYGDLKNKLLRYAALTGLAGTIVADLVKGTEDAIIYGAGVIASLVYLFFLTLKTDTIASADVKLGSNVSNVRFYTPLVVLVGVALYNKSNGAIDSDNYFSTVSAEQFGAAMLGFLTYRLPLFAVQLQEAFKDDTKAEVNLPGSAGYMYKLLKEKEESQSALARDDLVTVLLVSGPAATGRSKLVQKFMENNPDKFFRPKMLDRNQEGVTFERFRDRDELLWIDPTGRYGITKDSIMEVGKDGSAVVLDADVDLAKKLTKVAGIRIVGVWVGLSSVADYEKSISSLIENGDIPIPEDETKETTVRARIRDAIKEIEYGISSGIFEFTILNDDVDSSLQQLKDASSYCFK